jgi:hypothetical protein
MYPETPQHGSPQPETSWTLHARLWAQRADRTKDRALGLGVSVRDEPVGLGSLAAEPHPSDHRGVQRESDGTR